ncbi:MAG: hypothetical protein KJO28_06745 [Desulfofustis sp.]|nr:hypothetical protein [Desulfofustis sp.]NNK57267.1 hypothetical protein [Desulfofustis sp.]RZW21402.1 MAG: hypothetical protein EX260_05900 [Desulfobulbaceae bacterium]
MIALLRRLNSNVSIQAELDIEVDRESFHLSVNDGEAIVLVDRWKDTIALAHHVGADSKSFKRTFAALDTELKRINITVYLRTRNVPVLGPKANPAYSFLIKNLAPVFVL